MDIVIKDINIITMDDELGIIKNGYVWIKGGYIYKIGTGKFIEDLKDAEIIDGKNNYIMPGLINCHTHAAMTLLRGFGEGLSLMRWLNEKIWPMESKFKKIHYVLGTKLSIIEMIKSGTTTFCDMYFMQEEVLKIAEEYNMRAVLGTSIMGDDWEKQLKEAVELNNLIKRKKSSLVKSMLAAHSPYTLSYEALKGIAEAAKENMMEINIHISETKDEVNAIRERYNKTSCELLEETGVFSNKTIGAHCIYMNDSDLTIMKRNDVSVAYNPQSNMKLASGVCRVVDMSRMGINVCLGTDGCSSNNNLNMFEEMETGSLLQKLWYKDATAMNGFEMLKIATVNGANALGIDKLGKIKEGYKADLIIINTNKSNMVPIHDIYSNIVFSANGSEVDTVIIGGKLVMKNRELVSIDEEKVLYECNKVCRELFNS